MKTPGWINWDCEMKKILLLACVLVIAATDVMAAARRLNRKLRTLDIAILDDEQQRKKLARVLRRTRKRVESALAAL